MSAILKVTRPSSLVDLVWPYAIVLDGETVGRLSNGTETSLAVAPGAHTLQIRSRHIVLGRRGSAGPPLPFEASEGETASFRCQPRTLRDVPYRPKTWLELEPC